MLTILTPTMRADAERCAAMTAPRTPLVLLQPFVVQIKRGESVRLSFDAMGAGKVAVQKQHEGLCEDGEQCVVLTREEAEERHRSAVRKSLDARCSEQPSISAGHREEVLAGMDSWSDV